MRPPGHETAPPSEDGAGSNGFDERGGSGQIIVAAHWPNRRDCQSFAADVAEARARLRRRRDLLAALEVDYTKPATWPTDPQEVAA